MPSPMSGRRNEKRAMASVLQNLGQCGRDAHRAGEIGPFKAVRIGGVETGDALDRRFEVIKAAFLHQRREFGPEARGALRFVRSEVRRGGKECVMTFRSGWWPYH